VLHRGHKETCTALKYMPVGELKKVLVSRIRIAGKTISAATANYM
jgi:hypothetical protein